MFICDHLKININKYYTGNGRGNRIIIYSQLYIGTNYVYLHPFKDYILFVQGLNQYYEPQGGIKVMQVIYIPLQDVHYWFND